MNTRKRIRTKRSGFTLIELIISSVVGLIVMLGLAVIFVGGIRAYEVTYDRVNADVITDGYYARRLFDAVVRKSSSGDVTVDEDGEWLEAIYYDSDESAYPDRYARFFTSGDELKVEYGTVDSLGIKQTQRTDTVCMNVSECAFKSSGNSAVIILELDSGDKANTIISSAYMHN